MKYSRSNILIRSVMCLIFYRASMTYRSRVILIKLDDDEGEDEDDDVIIKKSQITNQINELPKLFLYSFLFSSYNKSKYQRKTQGFELIEYNGCFSSWDSCCHILCINHKTRC